MNYSLIKNFVVNVNSNFNDILKTISKNSTGLVFLIDDNSKLIGSVSDGDIRRYILKNKNLKKKIDINEKYINKKVHTIYENDSTQKLFKLLERGIKAVPRINQKKQVFDICTYKNILSFPIANPQLTSLEATYVNKCLKDGWISSRGEFISNFQNEFSKYLGYGYSCAVSNGTAAIELAIKTFGFPKNSEIILPDFTFAASINAILNCGMKPVICDVRMDTWTIDYKKITSLITNKTKAILPVHIYGQPYHISEIVKIAKKNKLVIIDDCAEGLGATYKKKIVNRYADATCFSFFGNKSITTGEGGMVVFRKKNHYKKSKIIREHGMSPIKKYWHIDIGSNYRITNIQCAIGYAQMIRINNLIKKRKKVFDYYDLFLASNKKIKFLPKNDWSTNSYWLYTILIDDIGIVKRNKLIKSLNQNGIETRNGFYNLSAMKIYKKYSKTLCVNSKYLSENTISLPTSVNLSKNQIKYICENLVLSLNKINS